MSVVSKNTFALLGNDDGDSDTPAAPVKTVDKTSTRTGKRNTENEPSRGAAPIANRRGGSGAFSGNEAAFRDRNVGSDRNRGKNTEEGGSRGASRGGYGARVRGGRGSRHPRDRDDRHNKGPASGSDKQTAHSWGAAEGGAELKDEQAGEEIAQTEQKEAEGEAAEQEAEPAEPEEKQVSYEEYLAQQAEKKLALESEVQLRKPNEGTKPDKKWANAKPLSKEEDEDYVSGTGGKAKRERERKTKQLVEIDNRYIEPDRPRGGRGGRGGGRGGTRGEGRGASRGAGRGGGGRGRGDGPINPNDQSAFPTLGS